MSSEYKYLYIEEGRNRWECLEWAINERIEDKNGLIIWDKNKGVFKVYKTLEDYSEEYPYESNHNTHEVIFGYQKQKPKFDMDKGNEEKYERILKGIGEAFKKEYNIEISEVVYDSSNNEKFSRHIVISNVVFANSREADYFTKTILKGYIKDDEDYKCLDKGVNKTTQYLRMPGSVKEGRKKRVLDGCYL